MNKPTRLETPKIINHFIKLYESLGKGEVFILVDGERVKIYAARYGKTGNLEVKLRPIGTRSKWVHASEVWAE